MSLKTSKSFFANRFSEKGLGPSSLTKLYIPALLLVILVSIANQVIIQSELKRQLHDSHVVNMAGRQRMLSQNIVKRCLILANKKHVKFVEIQDLINTVHTWTYIHNSLKNRDTTFELAGSNNEVVQDLFVQIEPYFNSVRQKALNIASEVQNESESDIPDLIDGILVDEGIFLSYMDAIVNQYELEARHKVMSTERIVLLLFIIVFLTIVFEGFFIFRPAAHKIRFSISALKVANHRLESSYKELETAQQKLMTSNLTLEERIRVRTSELKDKNELLKRIIKDLNNFVYTASHDLKAPISNIEGLLKALEESVPEVKSSGSTLVEMMHQSIDRFRNILSDLSDTGKIRNEILGLSESVSFKDVLDDVKVSIKDLITQSDALITEDFGKAPEIRFSRKNLRSIIFNLLSNAIKYRSLERRPVVNISTEQTDEFVILKVSDNGMGIKEEDIEKVFAIYTRLEGHENIEGSGVGMSIVRKVVENSGGKIEVSSKAGEGSTFEVYFKINHESPGEATGE